MHLTTFLTLFAMYLGLNFLCALFLHIHAEHQAHLKHRALDVVVHFVVLTLLALPALAVVLWEALFGAQPQPSADGGASEPPGVVRAA